MPLFVSGGSLPFSVVSAFHSRGHHSISPWLSMQWGLQGVHRCLSELMWWRGPASSTPVLSSINRFSWRGIVNPRNRADAQMPRDWVPKLTWEAAKTKTNQQELGSLQGSGVIRTCICLILSLLMSITIWGRSCSIEVWLCPSVGLWITNVWSVCHSPKSLEAFKWCSAFLILFILGRIMVEG